MTNKTIILGGIPEPIGGVTTFLRRLLHRDIEQIEWLLDFYPGKKEPIRADCQQKVIRLGGKVELVKWLWMHRNEQVGRELFFNFSTPRALPLTLLCPKVRGARWTLMLHHGQLYARTWILRRIVRLALSRFDEIKSLSGEQYAFYMAQHIPPKKIMVGSSYCVPADHSDNEDAMVELQRIRGRYRKVLVMSGFPKALYNLELGIEALAALNRDDCALCVFIYGAGELRERLLRLAEKHPWLFLFDNRPERYFNTFLRQSDALVRLTETESFGISVWDAYHWGVKIIASDVCHRPLGTYKLKMSGFPSKKSSYDLQALMQHVLNQHETREQ